MSKDQDFKVTVTTNMCECFEQKIKTSVCPKCDKLRYQMNCEIEPEHYGPFGTACVNTGQDDAGECWICSGKRIQSLANEMQLVAGRYQFQFQAAMKLINKVDDMFEYRYEVMTPKDLQVAVHEYMAEFTKAVSAPKEIPLKSG